MLWHKKQIPNSFHSADSSKGIPCVEQYPYLFNLLGGWFHQDFDIQGDTIEKTIASFRESTPAEDLMGTRADIHRFLRLFDGPELDRKFREIFQSGVSPAGWEMDTKQWLLYIDQLLK